MLCGNAQVGDVDEDGRFLKLWFYLFLIQQLGASGCFFFFLYVPLATNKREQMNAKVFLLSCGKSFLIISSCAPDTSQIENFNRNRARQI